MDPMTAFSYGCSSAMSEQSAGLMNSFLNGIYQRYEHVTGWLSNTLTEVKESHEKFMSSRMWEFSKRINGKEGVWVGAFDIGYLSEVEYQRNATGFMRDYIMANPAVMSLYLEERISGFEGDFNSLCNGVGRGNFFYDMATDGLVRMNEETELLERTSYTTSRNSGKHLSFGDRLAIRRTWDASNAHIAKNLFDFTDPVGGNILSIEEVEKRRAEAAENEE